MWEKAGEAFANFLKKWYLNQNLLTLMVSITALGIGECCGLCFLKWVGLILSSLLGLSVIATMAFYACEYCHRKHWKAKEHKLDYKRKESGQNDKPKRKAGVSNAAANENTEYQLSVKRLK